MLTTQAVNEHNASIQSTTKSIHEETVRVVDAQMKDVATQMQALDDFVKRAKSQNEDHRASHVQSLQRLGSSVKESHIEMGAHFTNTHASIIQLDSDTAQQNASFHSSLLPLLSALRQPLSDLRTTISSTPIQEYIPTGSTPQKTEYAYPTILPRTETHEKLLSTIDNARPLTNAIPSLSPSSLSPTKSAVYTDSPANTSATTSPVRPSSTGPGLQERNININAALPATRSRSSLSVTGKKAELHHEENPLSRSLMGPPPLKRHATSTESKLPQKFGGRRGKVEKENLEFSGSLGGGRRLRSSPNA